MRFATLGTLMLAGCASASTPAATGDAASPTATTTAIVNAIVIPMDSERVISDATVIVRGDRIVWVGPSSAATIPAGATRVDVGGAFVLPGLADLHVHTEARDLPVYLQQGVTTIREMNGSPDHLALRDRIRRGGVAGPTMHVAGTLLAGVRQRWRHRLIATPDEARLAVREQAAAGYEFIKVYDGLSADTYGAIVDEARRHDLRVIGHVPAAVGLDGVLAARQTEIEHVEQIVRGFIYRDSTGWRARVDSIARAIAGAGTWVNPTLAVEEGLSRSGTAWYAAQLRRPEMRLVDSSTFAWWSSLSRPRTEGVSLPLEYPSDRSRTIAEMKRATVKALHERGARLLMGSDLPNPLMIAGYALHDELSALVGAGLSPFAAIATATRDAGAFLGGDRFGIVVAGARADLVIVAQNPLDDVRRLRDPRWVMTRGIWSVRP